MSSPWLRFLRRGLSVLLISALPAFALAGNFGDCTLAPPTPNSVQAGNNEIVEIEFQVVRSPSNLGVPCTGVTGTVNADANGTIVSVLPDGPDPSPHDFIADENQTVTVRYATGPSNGDGTLFIACTASECAGHSTDAFPYQIVVVDRTLDFVGQNSFNGDPGQSIQLIVHAADDGISPLAPVPIDWIISGPGTLDTPSSNTDVNGDSFNTVNVLAATPGNDIINITATRSDAPTASVSFQIQVSVYELTVDAPAPGSQVQGGTTVILSVLYRVNGIPIDTAQVNWSFDQNPNGSSLQLGTTSTTSSGIATNVLTVGTPNIGAPASPIVVHAAIAAPAAAGLKGGAALPSAVFTLTPYDLVTVSTASGDNQSADVGVGLVAPLVVGLTRNGAPDGVGLINWTVDPPGAATLSSGQTASDGQGNSSVTVTTVNSGGLFTVTAAHHDDPTQTAVFQANGVAIGVLDLEKPSDSGDGQFGATDTPVANPLVVVATLDGAPQTGVGITWSVASGSATLSNATSPTDNAGRSSVNVTFGNTAGNVVVRATRNDDNTVFEEYFLQSFLKQLVKPPNGSGDGQSGSANAALPQPLVAVATINGAPESGVTVNWSVVSGSATLSNITNPTDSSGRSSATVTLGNSGPVVVRAARADHPSQFQDYNLTALDVRTLDKPPSNSGDGQSGMIGTTLPQPLVVFARNNGAAAAGVQVTWTASNGATVTPASVTDSTGRTQVTVQLGNTPGPVTVTATRADATTANASFVLHATTTPAGPALTIEKPAGSGDGTSFAPGETVTLVARTLANGLPDAGVPVFWSSSGSALLGAEQSISDAQGLARVVVTAGMSPGAVTVSAVHGQTGAAVSYGLTVTGTSQGAVLAIVSGDNQTAAPDTRGDDLVVRLTRNGAPVPQADVAWSVLQGSATLDAASSKTDGSGQAGNGIDFGSQTGEVLVRATAEGASVTFHLRVQDGVVHVLHLISGNDQRGPTGTRADQPIVVEVVDGHGDPVAGKTIDWAVQSGSAMLDAATTSTDGNGRSMLGFRFGNTAGPVRIRASIGTAQTQVVLVDATAFAPTLAIVAGDNQTGAPGSLLPQDLVVQIAAPAGAKTLAGVTVRWNVVDGGGTLAAASSLTDASGRASNRYTLGATGGAQHVRAALDGAAAVTFTETAVAAAGPLTIVSGNNQVLPTRSPSAPMVVSLATTAGVPIQGAVLLWSAGNAELANVRTTTDAQGRAGNSAEVLIPGNATVTVTVEGSSTSSVVFTLNGGVANIPQLGGPEEGVANAIDHLCPTLIGLSNLTPEQADLRARCLELVNNAGDHPDQVEDALGEMRQDVALAQSNAAFISAQAQFDNVKSRIAALRSGASGADFSGLAVANSSGVMPLSFLPSAVVQEGNEGEGGSAEGQDLGSGFSRWGFFASGIIGRGSYDGTALTPEYDYDSNGLTAGVDYRVNDQWIVGGSLGWNQQETDLAQGEGAIETDGWSVSGYTTWYHENQWYLDGVLTFGSNDYDLERHIHYSVPGAGGTTTSVDQLARASTGGDQLSLAVSFGRDFQRGNLSFGPYFRGMYTRVDFDSYEEQLGGGVGSGLGLAVDERELTSMTGTLGGKLTWALSRDWGILMPHAQLEWEHEFEDDPQQLAARFLHDPTRTMIRVDGDEIDTDFYNIGLGVSALFANGRSAFLYYEHLAGSEGLSQDNLSLGVRLEF